MKKSKTNLFSIIIFISIISLIGCNTNLKQSINEVNSFLDTIYVTNDPGASILIMKNGKIVFQKAYGMADIKTKIPIETTSVFGIGSITKQFTAIAIMQLAEQNLLSLDDNISKYFPEFPAEYRNITICHLLNHTSGIIDLIDLPEWFAVWPTDVEPAGLVKLFIDKPLLFQPGEKHRYSNAGYVLLGLIIERVTGNRYEDQLDSSIFIPLKMNNTFINHPGIKVRNLVTGYQLTKDGYLATGHVSSTHFYGGGSVLTNTNDMAKWYRGLKSGKIINTASVHEAMSPTMLNDGETANYGFGFEMSTLSNMEIIEHGGSTVDSEAYSLWIKEMDIHIVILSNFIVYPGTGLKSHANPRSVAYRLAEIFIKNHENE